MPRILLAALLLVSACTGQPAATAPTAGSTGTASGRPAAGPSAAPSAPAGAHVFVIVMENRPFAQAIAQPFTARLAAASAVATAYHAVAHPSLPNYLALTAGSTFGIADDGYHRLPAGGIGAELTQAGIPWRAYMEGMTRGCLDSPYPYAVKHNPFAYYGGACPAAVVPLTALAGDLAGDTPRFVWITPDLCHDGHDCSSAAADTFLAGLVPQVMASAAWRRGGLLLLTWDEDDGGTDNRVLTIAAAPGLGHRESGAAYDHYSLLAAVEDRLGVARLGRSAGAAPLDDLLG